MENINKTNSLWALIFLFTLSFSNAFAQQQQQVREDFSEKELTAFVDANEKIIEIEKESEKKMISAIEDEGFTVDEFNEMVQTHQDPNKELDATQEEMVSFNNAAQEIIKQTQEKQKKIISAIEDEDIKPETYQAILIGYQKSPKVQEDVNKILSERGN
ncbi:MAG: DUF4168 domain-containing protein [Candidatus Cyclobacteriaceae bacterium M2_1C_046]